MELNFKEYPKGFVFSDDNALNVPQSYKSQKILDRYYYQYDSSIKNTYYEKNGCFIIIHGHYALVHGTESLDREKTLDYLLELYNKDYAEFLNQLDYLAGRYVLIIGKEKDIRFYPDASAMRTVYYSLNKNIVSSHANLINEIITHDKDKAAESFIAYGINWNNSIYKDIKALTPNLFFNFISKETTRFYPREWNKYKSLNEKDRLTLASDLWKGQYSQYLCQYDKTVFSITGGWDSRVSLAMFNEHWQDLNFFTYTTNDPNPENNKDKRLISMDGDKVREILNDFNLNHQFIVTENVPKKLSEKDKNTVVKNTIGKHNFGFLRIYKHLFPEEKVLHIRSNLHEIGRAYLRTKAALNTTDKVKRYFINDFVKKHKDKIEENNINIEKIADEGIKSFKLDEECYDFHRMELYYWENRMGRWHAEIMNETDVCYETFSPFNMRTIIEISLSFDFEKRKSNYFFAELINKNHPVLNFYGKNSKENLYEENKRLKEELSNKKEGSENLRSYSQKSSEKNYDKISTLKKDNEKNQRQLTEQMKQILELNRENVRRMNQGLPLTEIQEDSIVNVFTISDNKIEENIRPEIINTIYLSEKFLNKNSYSKFDYFYKNNYGILKLNLINKYHNEKGNGYIDYEILVNDKIYLCEDISLWKYENTIFIHNLKQDDKISIRLKTKKDIKSLSWKNASKLKINELKEFSQNQKQPKEITTTSPYSIIFK